MSVSDATLEHVRELLTPLGEVSFRRMFGGAGVYRHGVMFALIVGDELYIKTDDETEARFRGAGSHPFTFQRKDGVMESMRYLSLPAADGDDADAASAWARLGLEAAMRARADAGRKPRHGKDELLCSGPWDEPDAG